MGIFRDIGAPGLIVLILGALSVSGIDLEKDDKATEDKKEDK